MVMMSSSVNMIAQIVIAFAFHAGVSLVLSVWSLVLWRSAVTSLLFPPEEGPVSSVPSHRGDVLQPKIANAFMRWTKKVGRDFIVFASQGRVARLAVEENRRALSDLYNRNERNWSRQKIIIDRILLVISDAQTTNGLGLLIAGLVQSQTLSLYHMHIIYDTLNFSTVSMCASLVNVFGQERERRQSRLVTLILFAAAYLAFVIVFGRRLQGWDSDTTGQCYSTKFIAAPGSLHPIGDLVYVSITCLYCFATLVICVSVRDASVDPEDEPEWSVASIFLRLDIHIEDPGPMSVYIAFLQYPLHLYMVIAMRAANEGLLSDDSENEWGFGQIVALVSASTTVMEMFRGVSDYRKFLAEHPPPPPPTATQAEISGATEGHSRGTGMRKIATL